MILDIILIIYGVAMSLGLVYCVDRLKKVNENKANRLNSELQNLLGQKKILEDQIANIKPEWDRILAEKEEAQRKYDQLDANFSQYCETLSEQYEEAREKYSEEYKEVLAESVKSYQDEIAEIDKQILAKQSELKDLRKRVDVMVSAFKRREADKPQTDFYRVQISKEDLQEVNELRDVASHLRSQDLLNKLIYKEYYERPCTDLIGRVVGQKVVSGIYKISNIHDGRCYVGQSVNIRDRFKQHFKRGLGVDAGPNNKLYEAMKKEGLQNFTFEILEECPYNMLNEREQYWQEVYHAKDFGYSIK